MSEYEYFPQFARGVRALVHPAARAAAAGADHEAFIATRLAAGGAALLAFPLYLAIVGQPDLLSALAFAWLLTPLALAFLVSRTGRLEAAQMLSGLSLSGLVATLAIAGGGPLSAVLPWLAAVPVEAALSRSRRVLAAAAGCAGAALAAVMGWSAFGVPPVAAAPAVPVWSLVLVGVLPALGYVTLLTWAAVRRPAAGREETFSADAAPDVLSRHRRNGNLTEASAAARLVLGAPAEDLLGDALVARIHVADRPAYLKAFDDAANGSPQLLEFRLRGPGEDAGFSWIEMHCHAVPDADGDVAAVMRDVTARKLREGDLNSALDEAERASLAKTHFLARMSHELRTPLNAIIGFSEILSQEMFGKLEQERHCEYAELIRTSGSHLLDIINDILDMSKIEAGSFEIVRDPFDLPALVRSCAGMLGPQAREADLRIDTDLPLNLPDLVADRRACKQILLNLIHNAVKFSRPGGRIVVGAYMAGPVATLYVADEGIGISASDLTRIGRPFVQVHSAYDRKYEGTGLGLSVVKGLAELHGGTLSIESEPGVGTRVSVEIPLAADESDASRRMSA